MSAVPESNEVPPICHSEWGSVEYFAALEQDHITPEAMKSLFKTMRAVPRRTRHWWWWCHWQKTSPI